MSTMWSTFCPEGGFKHNKEVQQQYCSECEKSNPRFNTIQIKPHQLTTQQSTVQASINKVSLVELSDDADDLKKTSETIVQFNQAVYHD